jgi:hypothetical protein
MDKNYVRIKTDNLFAENMGAVDEFWSGVHVFCRGSNLGQSNPLPVLYADWALPAPKN